MNVFFGDAGKDCYITRIMSEPVWPAFRYWLLNVVEQVRPIFLIVLACALCSTVEEKKLI